MRDSTPTVRVSLLRDARRDVADVEAAANRYGYSCVAPRKRGGGITHSFSFPCEPALTLHCYGYSHILLWSPKLSAEYFLLNNSITSRRNKKKKLRIILFLFFLVSKNMQLLFCPVIVSFLVMLLASPPPPYWKEARDRHGSSNGRNMLIALGE